MLFRESELDWLCALLAEVADAEILPRFRRLKAGTIRQKASASDLVTDADEEAERVLTERLRGRYPDALVVGEEACEKDRSLLDALPRAELAFVLDPVDGTFNFASGLPLFGVILAAVVNGETAAGIIYDPVTRSWALAAKGTGAWLLSDGGERRSLRVASPAPLEAMIGVVSWQYFAEPDRSHLARNGARILSPVNYHCSAHEYRLLADGISHFSGCERPMPWDHLAGVLIHAEAGGWSAMLDGRPYRAGELSGGLLLAPDRESWRMLRRELWAA